MNSTRRCVPCLLSLLLLTCCPALGAGEEEVEPGQWHMSTDGVLFSLRANQVPMEDLLMAIQRVSAHEIKADTTDAGSISLVCNNVPLEGLLDRLGLDYFLLYSRPSANAPLELQEGWVSFHERAAVKPSFPALVKGGSTTGAAAALSPTARARLLGYEPGSKEAQAIEAGERVEVKRQDVGTIYRSAYPVTVSLNGSTQDWPEGVPWQQVNFAKNPTTDNYEPDPDASFEVASVANEDSLFLAVRIHDDMKTVKEGLPQLGVDDDDMIKLVVDSGSGSDPFVFHMNRHQVMNIRNGQLQLSPIQYVEHHNGTRASIVDQADGWFVELAIPFETLNMQPGQNRNIGFNVEFNDNDAEDEHTRTVSWSAVQQLQGSTGSGTAPRLGSMQFIDVR